MIPRENSRTGAGAGMACWKSFLSLRGKWIWIFIEFLLFMTNIFQYTDADDRLLYVY